MLPCDKCGLPKEKLSYTVKTVYRTSDEIFPVTFGSMNTTHFESADKVAKYHCNCKYLWLRELHGVSAFMMSNSLKEKIFWACIIIGCASYSIYNTKSILDEYGQHATTTLITILPVKKLKFPTMVFCPRYPDFLNYYNILSDMYQHLGYMENSTNFDVLRFAITGFGIDNAGSEFFNETYQAQMNDYYLKWKGNRSQFEMFDFVYNQNGYTCQDMFQTCYGGMNTYNCCDIFEPTYVMIRGRCFRLIDSYYQNDTDEVAKVSIYFNNMTSPILNTGIPPQLVMYNGDSNTEVSIYPRIYLNSHDWNRIRYSQKVMKLLPDSTRCSTDRIYQGKFTCFVYKWLMQLVTMFNCTVPYYKYQLPYLADVDICEASLIVANFHNISLTPATIGYKCIPACSRIENSVQLTSSIDVDPDQSYMFRLEASFTYLEYEQYREIRTTSTPGFISELGGQTGLFVGCSVMTLVQLINSIVIQIYKLVRNSSRKHGWSVFFGLFTTHHTEPFDKFYPRPIPENYIEHLETIPEEDDRFDADGTLFNDALPPQIYCDGDEDEVGDFESIELSILGTPVEETPSSISLEEELPSSIFSSEEYPRFQLETMSEISSEPHDTVSEDPENVRTAKYVMIKVRDPEGGFE
ncbi:unnamed protein product [Caenorhabditis angaria]|uniref:DEgenerin Like n=1 Tax=Caenorhabditis angaria TaxID=860376 RepID=A0A9P1IMU4_9PELO|nr:unnamed protein product [Caenorhabditis angaria]